MINYKKAGVDIDAELAWETTRGAKGVTIAIIDSGVDYTHEDLASNMWVNPYEIPNNNVDDDRNGFIDDVRGWDFGDQDNDPKDNCSAGIVGHGTLVAGVAAAAGDNNIGITGVAWNSSVLPLKAVDNTCGLYMSAVAQSIDYAVAAGAKVINMSLGQSISDPILESAVNNAYAHGVVLVAAAMNFATSTPYYPAAYPNVIAVAATDRTDKVASFSDFGSWVDLAAPGVAVPAPLPGNRYGLYSGTSNASPMTAGVAALILSVYPMSTPEQVREKLLNGTENITALNPTYEGGAGQRVLGVIDYKVPPVAGGNKKRAEDRLLSAYAIDPKNPYTVYYLGEYYHTMGNKEKAGTYLKSLETLEVSPEHGPDLAVMQKKAAALLSSF
jgi:subtilisin family serine protease